MYNVTCRTISNQLVMGPVSMAEPIIQPVKGHDDRPGQEAPQDRVLRAYLPPEVAPEPGVVPYPQSQPAIEHQPRRQLPGCDNEPACHGLEPQRPPPGDALVAQVQRDAQQRGCTPAKSPPGRRTARRRTSTAGRDPEAYTSAVPPAASRMEAILAAKSSGRAAPYVMAASSSAVSTRRTQAARWL